jgi:hypothetical protein
LHKNTTIIWQIKEKHIKALKITVQRWLSKLVSDNNAACLLTINYTQNNNCQSEKVNLQILKIQAKNPFANTVQFIYFCYIKNKKFKTLKKNQFHGSIQTYFTQTKWRIAYGRKAIWH